MERKKLLALLGSIALVLVLMLAACTQQGGTTPTGTTTGAAGEPVYKVLNPQGIYIPVDCKPDAPRLDSLAGKTILFYESEATNMQMPTLLTELQTDYPTATFVVVHTESFGEMNPTEDQKKNQAVIRGVGW